MKIIKSDRIIVVLALMFSLVGMTLPALVKSPPEKALLPNGLRVIVVEDKSLPVAAAGLIFNSSVYYQKNCNSGLGRIYRSLLESAGFAGENRYDFNARLEKVGILNEFGGGQDMFYAAATGNADQLPLILESLCRLGFSLKPEAKDFDTAKNEAVRYAASARKFPQSTGLMERMIWKDLYPDQAVECRGPINEEKLAKIELSDLKAFAETVFVPNNAVLVVIGDVSASDVFTASMQQFGSLQASVLETPESKKSETAAKSRKTEVIDFLDIEDTEVLVGFEAPGYNDPDMPAAFLWQASMQDVNNSWLENTIRKDFPELKNLFARYVPGRDRGVFLIGFTSREDNVNRPVNMLLSSLANLYMNPPKGNEMRRISEMMQLKNLEKRESRLERVFDLGFAELMGNFRIAESIDSAYDRVTPTDMQRVAHQMFSNDRYAVRIFYPLKYQKAEENPVKLKTLPNGARAIVRSFAGSEVVGLTLLFGVDACAANENDRRMTRLVAEMVASYINDNENRRLNNRLDDIAARVEAVFNNESLIISARTKKQKLPELLEFLKNTIVKPDFSEKFFKTTRAKVLERFDEESNQPHNIVINSLIEGMYPGMNLTFKNLSRSDFDNITYEMVGKFYREWAVASNLCISAVGNFDSDKTLEMIGNTFADFPTGKGIMTSQCPAWVGSPLEKTEVKEVAVPGSGENAFIAVGFRMKQFLKLNSREELRSTFGANSVLSHLLFASSNALIAEELKKIDAYRGLWGSYRTNKLFSVFSFYAAVPADKVDAARKIIEEIIARIPQMEVSTDNIQAAGQKLRSYFNRALEKSDAQSAVLASYLWNGLKPDFLEEILSLYSSVTVEDVKKSARENFNRYLMIIGRPKK